MISKILIATGTFLVIALAIFAVVVAFQPSTYLLERSLNTPEFLKQIQRPL